jgi:uncharacterized protein YjiS (DUF1127 family)
MAVYDHSRLQYEPSPLAMRLGRILPDVVGRLAAWNDARVTRNALSRLSDRELEDIGLNRGDIEEIARR